MSKNVESYEKGMMLHWEKAVPATGINFGYDENVLRALEEYYGEFPLTLTKDDVRVLRAMQTAGGGRPLDELIDVVQNHGPIRVWWKSCRPSLKIVKNVQACTEWNG